MKKISLIIVLILLTCVTFAQDWIRYYGSGQQPFSSYCIEDYDKGYILAGSINNIKYGWIIKTDINGNQLWDIKIGDGINATNTANIEQTPDHGFILCGSTRIFNPPHTEPYIMKLDKCGELEWCKGIVYDNDINGAISVKPTSDGGFVMAAIFYGNNPDDLIRMFKFDSVGELVWYRIYNGDPNVVSERMRTMYADDSTFLLTGYCYYPNWIKPYYIKTDTSGNVDWTLAYSQHTGLGFIGEANATVKDSHGNYYSAGRNNSPELLKISGNGYEIMNVELIPGSYSGNAVTILLLNDTTLVFGAAWSMNGTDNELAMLKTDTLGNIVATKNLPNPDHSDVDWSEKTYDNKIIVIGTDYLGPNSRIELFKFNSNLEYDSVYTQPFTYDSLCPDTIVSHIINLNCGILVSADEHLTNPESTALKVFPNPAIQKITVEFPKSIMVKTGQSGFGSTTVYHHWKSTILEVYDLTGKKVFEKVIIRAETSLEIDVSQWSRGMYNFRLRYNKQAVAGEKVMVQ